MLATPLLLLADEFLTPKVKKNARPHDDIPEEQGHVVIAGFGRFGQIVARVLRARNIPFTALDESAEQVDFVARFGSKAYYGDAGRLDILEAARTDKARAFVLAIDNVDASVHVAQIVRQHFPNLTVYARARDRQHVHRLMDLGVKIIRRETFLSALDLTRQVLGGLGFTNDEIRRTIDTFKAHDERRLYDDYAHYTDDEKIYAQARKQNEELEELFTEDVADEAKAAGP